MPNYLFSNEISDRIIELISTIDELKSVTKGDLSNLPSPELFQEFLPMCIVKPTNVKTEWANITNKILAAQYEFKIFYLKYYNIQDQNQALIIQEETINESQPIANLLLNSITLDDYKNSIGYVTQTELSQISFSNSTYELFKELQIPIALVEMDYCVYCRTFVNK